MFPTVEVRWFYKGAVPPRVEAWFLQGEGEPDQQPSRVDYYLRVVDGASLGVKLREGRIEVKQRYGQYGAERFRERTSGRVAHWRKWSFELARMQAEMGNLGIPDLSWIKVRKERWLRRYEVNGEEVVVAASDRGYLAPGCEVELTRVYLAGDASWTVCLEAFGGEDAVGSALLPVARHVFEATHNPPALGVEDSYGYPRWLELRHAEIGQRLAPSGLVSDDLRG